MGMFSFGKVSSALRSRVCLSFLCLSVATPALSFDAVLQLSRRDAGLRDSLSQTSLVMSAEREGVTAPLDILAAAQADYGKLVTALYARGYFGPVIRILIDGREAADIPPLARLGAVRQVRVLVDTGPAFRLGAAQVGPLAPGTELPDEFATGEPALIGVIGDAAGAAVDGWRDLSYAKARIAREEIVARHRAARLDVRLGVAPGPKVTFGRIHVPKPSAVRKDRIRRIAGIKQGKPFDPVELERAAERLRRTGAFSSVTIREAETLGPGNTMDMTLDLVDAKPRRFGFGAEIESIEGMTLSAFWLHRNLFGGAERFRIEAEFAGIGGDTEGIDSTVRVSLNRPSTFDSDTDLYLLFELEQLDEPLYFAEQINLEGGVSHYFSEGLEGRIGLAFRYSDVRDELGSRTFTHLALPIEIAWDKRDDELDATDGFYVAAEGLPYLGLDGSASGGRAYVDVRGYRTLGQSDIVVAGRLQFGTILGSSIPDTPSDLLFLSGGSGTVRGQAYQSLSVLTGTARTGGRSFLGFAGETRFPVYGKFSGAVFYDVGYVGRNSFPDDTGDWHSGAGLGARYDTAFGPIRVDLAVPVTGPDTSGFEFYIGIGQAF